MRITVDVEALRDGFEANDGLGPILVTLRTLAAMAGRCRPDAVQTAITTHASLDPVVAARAMAWPASAPARVVEVRAGKVVVRVVCSPLASNGEALVRAIGALARIVSRRFPKGHEEPLLLPNDARAVATEYTFNMRDE